VREPCDVKAVRKARNPDRDGRQSCRDTPRARGPIWYLVKRIEFVAVTQLSVHATGRSQGTFAFSPPRCLEYLIH
jgi:hypothetical protein